MKRPVFIFDRYTDGHHDFYSGLLIDGLLEDLTGKLSGDDDQTHTLVKIEHSWHFLSFSLH